MSIENIILLIPLLPLLGFLLNGSIAIQTSRGKTFVSPNTTSAIGCSFPIIAFLLSVAVFLHLLPNTYPSISHPRLLDWMTVGRFDLSFGLMVDHLSALMLLVITGVGSLIHIYSVGYMSKDPAYSRYMAYLNLFLFFMLVLVMADSLVLLFVGWEGVGLCSYLLIGFWFTDSEKASAGKKAFIVNRVGDFGFLIGMFLIATAFFSSELFPANSVLSPFSFTFLKNNAWIITPEITLLATLCLFFGATGKSAQIPLYIWLPDAMAGPTPVSALIHAATMVTAGIYMIARLHFLFVLSPVTLYIIAVIGAFTALGAAMVGVTQYDIKKVLAYSTVSQLGYMFLALGVGAFTTAMFHVITHAFFKACLFLCAGSVIHSLHHEQDMRNMGGLWSKMPITATCYLLCTLAIAGIPPFSGFFSKDEILYMTYANGQAPYLYWLGLITAGLTAFYMTRSFIYTFLGKTRYAHPEKIHESPSVMTTPLIILATLATVGGFMGLPHILGHSWIGDWLAFLGQKTPHHIAGSTLQEAHLMVISVAVALISGGLAFFVYRPGSHITQKIKMSTSTVYQLVYNKFRIDELYDLVIVQPLAFLSNHVLFKFFDRQLIDGLFVNGMAHGSRFLARTASLLQTGVVGHYVLYLLIGLFAMIVFFTWI